MDHIEVRTGSGSRLVPLAGDRVSIGKARTNQIALDESVVSRLHAVIERYPSGWTIRDLGSKNGTLVNGESVLGERALRPGDEIAIGSCRLVFRSEDDSGTASSTSGGSLPPTVSRRELDVLLELCRPVLENSMLSEPASVQEIAAALVVTPSAVKKHLGRLYDKFDLSDVSSRRRGRLAAEAIRRGVVSRRELKPL